MAHIESMGIQERDCNRSAGIRFRQCRQKILKGGFIGNDMYLVDQREDFRIFPA